MTWRNWFSRSQHHEDARVLAAYRLGLHQGIDIMQRAILADQCRRASASYPDDEHGNVISLARHRNYLPPGSAA